MPPSATTFHSSKFLRGEDLGPVETHCSFCKGQDREFITHLQRAPDVALLRCRTCSLCSASRLPTSAALQAYYSGYYERNGVEGSDDGVVTFHDIDRFAKHLAAGFRPSLRPGPLKMLDFGGGDGAISFRSAAALLGPTHPSAEVTLVEFHEELAPSPSPSVITRHAPTLETLASQAGSFDIAIASAILEHLPDANVQTELLLDLLRPGGLLYIRTPFVVPLLKIMKRVGLDLDFTFPGHMHDMGQEFWEGYFSRWCPCGPHRVLESRPALVETSFRQHPARTLAAHVLKAPWKLLGRRYGVVGGWEVFVQKRSN